VVGKKAGGSRHLYEMGNTLFKRLESACNLSRSFPGKFAFGPSPLPKRRTSKRVNLLLMQPLPVNRWRFLQVHTKYAVWADHEKS
jgi:hypothetical protein